MEQVARLANQALANALRTRHRGRRFASNRQGDDSSKGTSDVERGTSMAEFDTVIRNAVVATAADVSRST